MIFEDRRDAGRKLAGALSKYRGSDAIVLAVPRGGVVVGYEVAKALDLPLDVVVPRKLGAPDEPELAIGAVSAWGDHEAIIDANTIRVLRVTQEYIDREIAAQLAEISRRLEEYRGDAQPPQVAGRTVIVVDDGIATGYTMRAALAALRRMNPSKLVLAVPVAPPDAAQALSGMVDEFYALTTPTPFLAVGHWYHDFRQTMDEEVVELLEKGRGMRNEE
jgi:putative phosphoribosyl transferase